jgi:magnesium-transporting ATPase (P-type)
MLELIVALSFMARQARGSRSDSSWSTPSSVFSKSSVLSAAVSALRRRLQVTARARRDGSWTPLPARELVVGEVVRIRAGDFVPPIS